MKRKPAGPPMPPMPPAMGAPEGPADQASEPMGEPTMPGGGADEGAMAAGMAAHSMSPPVEGGPMHRKAHNLPY